jgi:hypothetical protein
MQTNYPLTLVALLLFILAGCTDASNPVGPDIDLRFTEDARSVSGESMKVAFDSADEYKRPGDMALLVAEGKFSFSQVIKRAFSDSAPQNEEADVTPPVIGFMVSQTTGAMQDGTGRLQFDNGDGYDHDFEVDVQHVQLNNDGSVSFDGRIMGREAHEKLGASWFFARATDGGDNGDSFAYYLGTAKDKPAESAFTTVIILQGGLTIYQQAF